MEQPRGTSLQPKVSEALRQTFSERLLTWGREGGLRQFPWRESRDPWLVLLSELLLQKTSSRQVEAVFPELASRYGTIRGASEADSDLQDLIKPLGVTRRAQTIRRLASTVLRDFNGQVPRSPEQLVLLDGVGPYTAAAVASFAFGERVPVVDTNVLRVFRRFFGVTSTKRNNPERDPELWAFAGSLLPSGDESRLFNMALLDFGATVCRATRVQCYTCPMREFCYHAESFGVHVG